MQSPFFNVALVEPEIPQNTGNIGRTCVGFNTKLHLIQPLAFDLSDTRLKRAGLDYWPHLNWQLHAGWIPFVEAVVAGSPSVLLFSTHAEQNFFDASIPLGATLIFGRETKGLSPEIKLQYPERLFKIPQLGPVRSFNLATAAAMVLSEAYRQNRHVIDSVKL